jgi:hypothetical protein
MTLVDASIVKPVGKDGEIVKVGGAENPIGVYVVVDNAVPLSPAKVCVAGIKPKTVTTKDVVADAPSASTAVTVMVEVPALAPV